MCAVHTRSFSRVVKVSLECKYLLRSTSLCCNGGMRWKKKSSAFLVAARRGQRDMHNLVWPPEAAGI